MPYCITTQQSEHVLCNAFFCFNSAEAPHQSNQSQFRFESDSRSQTLRARPSLCCCSLLLPLHSARGCALRAAAVIHSQWLATPLRSARPARTETSRCTSDPALGPASAAVPRLSQLRPPDGDADARGSWHSRSVSRAQGGSLAAALWAPQQTFPSAHAGPAQ